MKAPTSPTVRHRLEYVAFRGVEAVLKRVSIETAFKAGELLGRIVHRFARPLKKSLLRNLRRAYGDEKSAHELDDLAAEVFERNGANLISSLRIPFLSDDEIRERVDFTGLPGFLTSAKRQGIVLVLPHMGNWELLAQIFFLTAGEIRAGTHYRPLNNALIDEVIKRRRKKRGVVLFSKQESTLRLSNFVRAGGVLAILADQRVGPRGAPGVFFGRPTTCSPLPHLIAKRGKGQLIGMHCATVGPARWEISFELIEKQSAQACADSIERAWRSSPADVFWFEDRWRLKGTQALDFLSKYPSDHGVTRPLRLVCLGEEADREFPPEFITMESREVDFNLNDRDLKFALSTFSACNVVPVDVFCAPPDHVRRLRNLTGKILVLPS